MNPEITLKLNQEEIRALVGLLDTAVKAGGLQVAALGAHFQGKVEAAVKELNEAAKEGTEE